MHLYDLIDPDELALMRKDGFVREQYHHDLPLAILNYSDTCAYAKAWNPTTLACRGLIYETVTGYVMARPWEKFFNYGETGAELDLDAEAEVTNKADGSLGILYGDGRIATRGSFHSEQAEHATRLYRERYMDGVRAKATSWNRDLNLTYLFEIIYPTNRIVLDYGRMDDLVLLGAVEIDTGRPIGPNDLPEWPGPRTEVFPAHSLREALALPDRANAEGVVVRLCDSSTLVKIKQADYVALHRIVTNTSARHLWEYLVVHELRALITDPRHWGSFLGLDPARAEEILAVGPDWLAQMLDGVPDEFHTWVRTTLSGLRADFHEQLEYQRAVADFVKAKYADPALQFQQLQDNVYQRELMRIIRGEGDLSLQMRVWRELCPEPTLPFAQPAAAA